MKAKKNAIVSTMILLVLAMVLAACAPNVARLENKGDVEKLIEALSYEKDASVRAEAAAALANLDAPLAVDPLLTALSDSDAQVRSAAVSALVQINGAASVKSIVIMLKDEDETVRQTTAQALAGLGSPAVSRLIDALDTTNKTYRAALLSVLIQIGEPSIDSLVDALTDKNSNTREAAQEGLLQMGALSAPALIDALAGADEELHQTLVDMLVSIGTTAIDPLIAALAAEDSGTAQTAREILVLLEADVVAPLIAVLNTNDEQVLMHASGALEEIGEPAIDALVQTLDDPERMQAAGDVLLEIGSPAVDALVLALQDENLCEAAGELLPHMGVSAISPLIKAVEADPDIIPYAVKTLTNALQFQDSKTRKKAADAVVEIGEAAVPLILEDIRTGSRILVGDTIQYANPVYYSAKGSAEGKLVNGGLCNELASGWEKKIVLCLRGDANFVDKVLNVQEGGGAGVILYNNISGDMIATLGEDNTSDLVVVMLNLETGQDLAANYQDVSVKIISDELYPEMTDSLVKIGAPALSYLITALGDPLLYDPVETVLIEIGSIAVDPLITAAKESDDDDIRINAISVLGDIANERAEASLISLLTDSSEAVRQEAATALGKLGSSTAIEALVAMVYDSNEDTRGAALYALETIGLPSVDSLLLIHQDESAPDVVAVADTLRSIFYDNQTAVINAAAAICDGEAQPNTVKFNRYEAGPHPLVILTAYGLKHSWTDWLPVEWLPYTPEDIQSVVCLGISEDKIVQICPYYYVGTGAAAPSITRYRSQLPSALRAASTGYQIASTTLRGSSPGYCPSTTSSFSNIYGSSVEFSDLKTWLKGLGIDLDK